jgi:hypothetical protein
MGLWDKVKGAVRTMTGGGATVTIEVGEATLATPFRVRVTAVAKADVEVSAVYVKFLAVEHAEVRDIDYDYGDGRQYIEYIEGTQTTYSEKFVVGEKVSLKEGQTESWDAEVTLPETANPSFDGQIISHKWTVMGALDCFGNDPDSGWQVIQVWDN